MILGHYHLAGSFRTQSIISDPSGRLTELQATVSRDYAERRRYVAARALLEECGHLDFHEALLELLGCARMSRAQAEHHLAALTDAFDATKAMVKTPFFFASDISDIARPIAIDGSRELIERSQHREAVFWIVATYCRCQKVLHHDAPAGMKDDFDHGYRLLLGDLGITSFSLVWPTPRPTRASFSCPYIIDYI